MCMFKHTPLNAVDITLVPYQNWKSVTKDDMKGFLAVNLNIGIVQLKDLAAHTVAHCGDLVGHASPVYLDCTCDPDPSPWWWHGAVRVITILGVCGRSLLNSWRLRYPVLLSARTNAFIPQGFGFLWDIAEMTHPLKVMTDLSMASWPGVNAGSKDGQIKGLNLPLLCCAFKISDMQCPQDLKEVITGERSTKEG